MMLYKRVLKPLHYNVYQNKMKQIFMNIIIQSVVKGIQDM